MSVTGEMTALKARLAAAERVCVLYSWTGAIHDTDRAKALHELWSEWVDLSGVSLSAEDHPDLSDERIAELAARRDETRRRTLERIEAARSEHVGRLMSAQPELDREGRP